MALIDSLISYWKLDEASGNALDAHGSNDLTDNNTVGSATGKINNARDFESGSSEYFSRADNADLSTGDIDFTIACWVQLESTAASVIVAKWNQTGNQRSYRLDFDGSRFRLLVSNNGSAVVSRQATTFGAPSTGVWYFLTAWHDSVNNQVGIAVNAGTADTSSHTTGTLDNTADFLIGATDTGVVTWDGLIDEVGFWKRVLTSDERTELYNSGNGLAYPFDTASSSPSASASSSPSTSPSTSPSSSPSTSPSISASASPSTSPSSSPSTSPSASASASPSTSLSASASSSPSASASASPSSSSSPSTSVSSSPSATASASPSASPSTSPSTSPSASASSSPSPSASVSSSRSASPSGEDAVITIEVSAFASDGRSVNRDSNRLISFEMTNEDDVVFDFPESQVR